MNTASLKRPKNLRQSRRVGRGGKRGKTSGKGMKGQKSRTGNSTRPELRDIIKKYPKRRGYGKNRARTVVPNRGFQSVNLDTLTKHFASGSTVSPQTLLAKGLVRRTGGKTPKVKVLSRGSLEVALTVTGASVSAGARAAITKAGGTVE